MTPRLPHRLLLALAAAGCAVGAFAQAGSGTQIQEGGILRISFSPAAGLDSLDPALSFTPPGWALLDATCARLMSYPDKPAPEGYRLQPEVAAGYTVSRDLKTYTFTLRSGFRFSDGSPVRASAFAHAINRGLSPIAHSPGAMHMRDIVGAADVLHGRQKTPAWSRRAREQARRPLQEAGAGLPRANGHAVLLRRSTALGAERGGRDACSRPQARTTSGSSGRASGS